MRRGLVPAVSVAFVACAQLAGAGSASAGPHDELIARHAAANAVPEALVRRVIRIESRGNPHLANKGNYGLMQIRLGTARGLGYAGDAKGLLDPDTNLTYAVKYLAGAYRAAGCNPDRAISYYQRGYYGAPRTKCEGARPPVELAATQAKAADVLKPRVVRVETIGAPNRPVVPFEPVRMSATTDGSAPLLDRPSPKAVQLAAIPLPPARPEFEPPRGRQKASHQAMRTAGEAKTERKPKAAKPAGKDDPIGLVSLVKKMAATDKRSGKQPPPQAPSPHSPQ